MIDQRTSALIFLMDYLTNRCGIKKGTINTEIKSLNITPQPDTLRNRTTSLSNEDFLTVRDHIHKELHKHSDKLQEDFYLLESMLSAAQISFEFAAKSLDFRAADIAAANALGVRVDKGKNKYNAEEELYRDLHKEIGGMWIGVNKGTLKNDTKEILSISLIHIKPQARICFKKRTPREFVRTFNLHFSLRTRQRVTQVPDIQVYRGIVFKENSVFANLVGGIHRGKPDLADKVLPVVLGLGWQTDTGQVVDELEGICQFVNSDGETVATPFIAFRLDIGTFPEIERFDHEFETRLLDTYREKTINDNILSPGRDYPRLSDLPENDPTLLDNVGMWHFNRAFDFSHLLHDGDIDEIQAHIHDVFDKLNEVRSELKASEVYSGKQVSSIVSKIKLSAQKLDAYLGDGRQYLKARDITPASD